VQCWLISVFHYHNVRWTKSRVDFFLSITKLKTIIERLVLNFKGNNWITEPELLTLWAHLVDLDAEATGGVVVLVHSVPSDDNLQVHSDKLVSVESSKERSCSQHCKAIGLLRSHSTRKDIQHSAVTEVGRSCCFCRLAQSSTHKSDWQWAVYGPGRLASVARRLISRKSNWKRWRF
jgi:hypothetical protein